MDVVKVKTEEGKERYFLADDEGLPIEPVLKFIKSKDNINLARNTLKMYCQRLKLYFEYIQQRELDFKDVTVNDLVLFVSWLQNPKVISVSQKNEARSPSTVNTVVKTVLAFYNYILGCEKYGCKISDELKRFVSAPSRNFKGFLYEQSCEQKKETRSILKLKVPKSKPKILSKEQIGTLVKACCNLRDKFLLLLLYETGIRIGEALFLWIEDFQISDMTLDIKNRGQLETNAEIKTIASPRKIQISQNLVDVFVKYITEYHTQEVETNHIFIKISGENKYKAMDYVD